MTIARPETTPSGPQAASSGEIRGLTGLRIVAAVWVVLFHFHFTELTGVTEVVGVLGPLITSGALGVDLFFVLSGFVIAHTYLASMGPALRVGTTVRFVWARFCRMWPVYALVFHLFGLWLLARLLWGSDETIAFQGVQPIMSVGQWVQQVLMVQMWNNEFLDGASWVGATWSISAEWLAYLLFPVGALVFFRLRNLPALVLAAGAVTLMLPVASSYALVGHPYYEWSWTVRILCGFGAGVLVHLAVARLPRTGTVRRAASRLVVVLPVLIIAGLWFGQFAGPGRGGVVIIWFPLFVGGLALADRGPAMLFARPALVQGGRVSYSLYLVHIPMFELFWLAQAWVPGLRGDTMLAHVVGVAVVLATYPVAAAAFRWVEEPARRRLRRMRPPGLAGQALAPPPAAVSPAPVSPAVARFAAARSSGAVEQTSGYAVVPAARPVPMRVGATVDAALAVPRHAAGPRRQPTLAAILVNAQRRRPAHRAADWADVERAQRVRSMTSHAGS